MAPVNVPQNESILCCVQLIGLVCLGSGLFMMVGLLGIVNHFLGPSIERSKGELIIVCFVIALSWQYVRFN